MHLRTTALRTAVACTALAALTSAHAAAFNLTSDWSDSTNPNGAWAYQRAGVAFAATVSNWSGFGTAWADAGAAGFGFTPALLKYDGVGSEPIDAIVNDIVGHTNTNDSNAGAGELSVRFTNPTAGTASVSGKVWDAHISQDRDQAWEVWVDGVLSASGILLGDGTEGRSNPDLFSLSGLSLAAGSIVELRVSRFGADNGGLVGMDMSITVDTPPPGTVPAPATWALALASLAGVGVARGSRRRRR